MVILLTVSHELKLSKRNEEYLKEMQKQFNCQKIQKGGRYQAWLTNLRRICLQAKQFTEKR